MEKAQTLPLYDFLRFLAITLVCLIGGLYLPLLGILLIIFTPTPLVLLVFRQGWKMGFMLLAFLVILLSMVSSAWYGMVFFVLFGGTGLILAHCFDTGYSKEKTLMMGFAANALIVACFFIILSVFSGSNINELISSQIDYNVAESIRVYEAMKIGKEQIAIFRNSAQVFKGFFLNAYTGLYGAFTTLLVLFNFLFSRKILSRLGIATHDTSPFSELFFPDTWVWGAIAGGLLWAFASDPWNILGMNLSIVFITVYGLQGFSILFFFMKKSPMSRLAKWALAFLLMVQPLLLFLVSAVGVFDTWFDFRKLKQKNRLDELIT